MIVVVYGGSGSGKSKFAEGLLEKTEGEKIYMATMLPYGEDGKKRIEKHLKQRENKGFLTVEKYLNIGEVEVGKNVSILLECMGNLLANEMFEKERQTKEETIHEILKDIEKLAENNTLIIVTNNVFSGIEECSEDTKEYIEMLGKINMELFKMATEVYEIVCGIKTKIK